VYEDADTEDGGYEVVAYGIIPLALLLLGDTLCHVIAFSVDKPVVPQCPVLCVSSKLPGLW
jgi:hypothetical protein